MDAVTVLARGRPDHRGVDRRRSHRQRIRRDGGWCRGRGRRRQDRPHRSRTTPHRRTLGLMPSENGLGDNFPSARILAFPASPSAVWTQKQIVPNERVTTSAMGALRVMMIAISYAIKSVLAACAPRQIIQAIVGWIVVKMATFQAFWARANKSLEDEAMNVATASGRVEDHSEVAMSVRDRRKDALVNHHHPGAAGNATCNGTNTSRVTHLVMFKPHNRFPHVTQSTVRRRHG